MSVLLALVPLEYSVFSSKALSEHLLHGRNAWGMDIRPCRRVRHILVTVWGHLNNLHSAPECQMLSHRLLVLLD